MSENVDYSNKLTKNCCVILERLDEKLLNHYARKYALRITTNIFSKKSTEKLECISLKRTPKLQNNKSSEESETKVEFKQKKRIIKPLSYTEDEDWTKEPLVKRTEERTSLDKNNDALLGATTRPQPSLINSNEKSTLRRNDCSKLKKICKNKNSEVIKLKDEISKIEERKEITSKNVQKDVLSSEWDKSSATSKATAGREIEILEEFLNPNSVPESLNCDATVKNSFQCDIKHSFVNSQSVHGRELEEGEYDSREDSEDDKNTVIFEKDSYKDTDSEVFEIDERELEWATRKLTNKEITNRKKPRLIKFKRKSLAGRNSATVRKSDTKFMETFTSGKETVDAETSLGGVSEDYLKEVCYLIKRLHELHQSITQQKSFFKELSNKDELYIPFSKVISAQQENFQKEIRKSQKTIIKCYEDMLFYHKPSEVALEIGKRTSLNVNEVTYVLSQCFLVEGAWEVEKLKNCVPEKGYCKSQKAFYSSESQRKIYNENVMKITRRTTQKKNCSVSHSHPYFPSERNVEFHKIQKLIKGGAISSRLPVRENSVTNSQSPVERVIKGPFHHTDSQCGRLDYEKLKFWMQTNSVQEPHSQTIIKDSRIKQMQHGLSQANPRLLLRYPFSNPIHTSEDNNGLIHPNQIVRASSNYPPNVDLLERSVFPSGSFMPIRTTDYPAHVQISNQIPEKSTANPKATQITQSDIQISSGISAVPTAQNKAGNVTQFITTPTHNFLNIFPLKTYTRFINPQQQVLTSTDQAPCPLEVIFTNSMGQVPLPNELLTSPQNRTEKQYSISNSGIELQNVSSLFMAKKVLDPTIPQKLTMKNCRLQAEPIIGLQTEKEMSEVNNNLNPSQWFRKEEDNCKEFPQSNLEDFKSRVYICAQNDCKQPGTRICKGCLSVIYCGETCQLKHWTQKHKAECHQLKELRG